MRGGEIRSNLLNEAECAKKGEVCSIWILDNSPMKIKDLSLATNVIDWYFVLRLMDSRREDIF